MRKFTRTIVLGTGLITGLTLSACIGRAFDVSKAQTFQPGITTEADAITALGPPIGEAHDAVGNHALGWAYAYGTPIPGIAGAAKLVIIFDSTGRMLRIAQSAKVGP